MAAVKTSAFFESAQSLTMPLQLPFLPTPRKFAVMVGRSEGSTPLNAFDGALLDAGIGNLNLLRVSSIVPPGCVDVPIARLGAAPGSLVPTAYEREIGLTPGEKISAAVGIGLTADSYGVIMEFAGKCPRSDAEDTVAAMVKEAFDMRGLPVSRMSIKSVEHTVVKCGCVLAAVAMWY